MGQLSIHRPDVDFDGLAARVHCQHRVDFARVQREPWLGYVAVESGFTVIGHSERRRPTLNFPKRQVLCSWRFDLFGVIRVKSKERKLLYSASIKQKSIKIFFYADSRRMHPIKPKCLSLGLGFQLFGGLGILQISCEFRSDNLKYKKKLIFGYGFVYKFKKFKKSKLIL